MIDHKNDLIREKARYALGCIGDVQVLTLMLERYRNNPQDERTFNGLMGLFHHNEDRLKSIFNRYEEKLEKVAKTMGKASEGPPPEHEFLPLAKLLLSAFPEQEKVRPSAQALAEKHITRISALGEWHFVKIDLGGYGYYFLARRVGDKWVSARVMSVMWRS
jgi:hypothetical protein